ncbi:hypothetical protein AVEN_217513-1 [Araneus ventricosus]|uniref:Uncharacterized protein n=1 Tax=Araneus ventricosus TaxID=182803 RepID=A0A4Y2L8Q2_ARAVE|nr:hypothetical protein AVEN_217513-1 [Araneus ventricosus]
MGQLSTAEQIVFETPCSCQTGIKERVPKGRQQKFLLTKFTETLNMSNLNATFDNWFEPRLPSRKVSASGTEGSRFETWRIRRVCGPGTR